MIFRSEEDEESLSRELMKKLTPAVLSKLRRCFKKAKDKNAAAMAVDRYLSLSWDLNVKNSNTCSY